MHARYFYTFAVICWLFFKINFYKTLFQEHYQSVNGLYPDQNVGSNMCPHCLQEWGNSENNEYKIGLMQMKDVQLE